ncbi:MAG: helix-turn-helix domain-containing protein [Bacillota bacterium]|nr:helix-turn-helix domain-containing protein [Bacillota bacterium]
MEDTFKIIIIDDDEGIIEAIKANLLQEEYLVDGFTTSKEGINAIKDVKYDLLILDYFIDNLNGENITEKIRKIDDELYIMLLTGKAEEIPAMETFKKMDVQMFCEKSAHFEKILIMIESAIKSILHSRKSGSFGIRLKKLRKNSNMSQDDLGKLLGLGRTAIANWETNQTEPTGENIIRLAEIFKVTTDYLLGHRTDFS